MCLFFRLSIEMRGEDEDCGCGCEFEFGVWSWIGVGCLLGVKNLEL